VRTGGGLGGIGAGHLVQQPVRGGAKALLVLLTAKPLRLVLRGSSRSIFFFEARRDSLESATIANRVWENPGIVVTSALNEVDLRSASHFGCCRPVVIVGSIATRKD
jgi:hypothetical protein